MIKINNLRKEFDHGVVALDKINMEIQDQEFIALLGPSGCGKSTTLNCLAGLLDTTSGEILFDGENVTDKAPKDRNIGMVFQSYALYPHLKVIDNIAFPLKQKGVSKEERHEKAREMAAKLQIEHLLDRRPTQLSGGQQQRVAMCRALVKEPKILLLDEPMSNLDARLKIEIREVIKKIQKELKVTSIIVTHDQEEAMAIADKIAILDNGNIQQYDTPEMLYQYPANLFVANFMGNPPMNFISAVIEKTGNTCIYRVGELQIPVSGVMMEKILPHAGKNVRLGVRSHQMSVCGGKEEGSLPVHVQMVENLGKELLITGDIHQDHIRVTIDDPGRFGEMKRLEESGERLFIRLADKINVFDEETKVNLIL
ncbi:sugar ABC transporter ATP-binding protein [Clostridium sp. chh4-2]|uniref:ABC transporter ATP-binding protein n=1 Tax=Clostridium sp. chh4-2 TaxID=2067550 RepID=UPI000CCEB4A8|nr:ABC transporter ATP-binding protein [Clostridium sp. chh4-2]PNV63180.1 sugar ABC transporter ATP-binding protein [Clostridium sp. chh4-2]